MVVQRLMTCGVRAAGAATLTALALAPALATGIGANPAGAPAQWSAAPSAHPGAPAPRAGARLRNFTVLHSFGGLEGANPSGQLLVDARYHLYGSTENGGAAGLGNLFEAKPESGVVQNIHSFTGASDGASPEGGPFNSFENVFFRGYLFGVTENGGAFGSGAVYATDRLTGATLNLHSFSGQNGDGAYPVGRLILFKDGNLYGTTTSGGTDGVGTIFRITPGGYQTVYSFTGGADGGLPEGGLQGATFGFRVSPFLYGVTASAGTLSNGTLFAFNPVTDGVSALYAFTGGNDGGAPIGDLVPDPFGNLYGVTSAGGSGYAGTVFSFNLRTSSVSTLYAFPTSSTFTNPLGETPGAGLNYSLTNGALYGTTLTGGAFDDGVVFRIKKGSYALLHSFSGADGSAPEGQVLPLPDGNVYGTTNGGGANGLGVIFALPQ